MSRTFLSLLLHPNISMMLTHTQAPTAETKSSAGVMHPLSLPDDTSDKGPRARSWSDQHISSAQGITFTPPSGTRTWPWGTGTTGPTPAVTMCAVAPWHSHTCRCWQSFGTRGPSWPSSGCCTGWRGRTAPSLPAGWERGWWARRCHRSTSAASTPSEGLSARSKAHRLIAGHPGPGTPAAPALRGKQRAEGGR